MNESPAAQRSPLATVIAFVVVTIAVIGAGILLLATRPQPAQITVSPPMPTATALPIPTPGPLTVYVTGAVSKPETLVRLPQGSRAQQAIEAAGGTTANADLQRVNLAALLHDGDQVDIPALGAPDVALATPSGGVIVHVNTATAEDLDTLPGVGPSLAQAIIDYRTDNGPFEDLDALDQVKGVGPALLQKIADLVAFD